MLLYPINNSKLEWQTDLLVAAAKTGKIINIKKGQFCAPSVSIFQPFLFRFLTRFISHTFVLILVYQLLVDWFCRSCLILLRRLEWPEMKMLWFVREEQCLATVRDCVLVFYQHIQINSHLTWYLIKYKI